MTCVTGSVHGTGSSPVDGAPLLGAVGPVSFRSLGAFAERRVLQEGRHSVVASARHILSGQQVVLKSYIRANLQPWHVEHVRREVALLSMLSTRCSGTVALLAAFEDAQSLHLVFPACLRGDLYQLLQKEQGCKLSEQLVATSVMLPLLVTLAELHAMRVVHRDIKPENVFLDLDGRVLLGDFGLAASMSTEQLNTRVGTLDYMAPEVLAMPTASELHAGKEVKRPPYNEKVDIWAMGCMAYELLVGKPPFEVEDPKETARLILAHRPAPVPLHLSASCHDFVRLALSADPEERPAAHQLLQHPWLQEHFTTQPQPASLGLAQALTIGPAKAKAGGILQGAEAADRESEDGAAGCSLAAHYPDLTHIRLASPVASPMLHSQHKRRPAPQDTLQEAWRCMFSAQLVALHERQQARARGEAPTDYSMAPFIVGDDSGCTSPTLAGGPSLSCDALLMSFSQLVDVVSGARLRRGLRKGNAKAHGPGDSDTGNDSGDGSEYDDADRSCSEDGHHVVESQRQWRHVRRRSGTSQFLQTFPPQLDGQDSRSSIGSSVMDPAWVVTPTTRSEAILTRPPELLQLSQFRAAASCNGSIDAGCGSYGADADPMAEIDAGCSLGGKAPVVWQAPAITSSTTAAKKAVGKSRFAK